MAEKKKVQSSLFDDIEEKKVVKIDDGAYTGEIIEIKRDTENFDYMRYFVKIDHESELTLQVSYPTSVSFMEDAPSSAHAKFLSRMGFKSGDSIPNFIKGLTGQKVKFLVQGKTTEKGEFCEIVKDSVKSL